MDAIEAARRPAKVAAFVMALQTACKLRGLKFAYHERAGVVVINNRFVCFNNLPEWFDQVNEFTLLNRSTLRIRRAGGSAVVMLTLVHNLYDQQITCLDGNKISRLLEPSYLYDNITKETSYLFYREYYCEFNCSTLVKFRNWPNEELYTEGLHPIPRIPHKYVIAERIQLYAVVTNWRPSEEMIRHPADNIAIHNEFLIADGLPKWKYIPVKPFYNIETLADGEQFKLCRFASLTGVGTICAFNESKFIPFDYFGKFRISKLTGIYEGCKIADSEGAGSMYQIGTTILINKYIDSQYLFSVANIIKEGSGLRTKPAIRAAVIADDDFTEEAKNAEAANNA